ncbi:hypothetical protein C1646_724056 [Rhizophagus diaphanus]|nr:hypothetical protein C1646_724056 [Rhizophagus diaphanus] [Rhizophagus sp. MUCL 43196]
MGDINIDLNIVKQEPFDEFDNTKPIDTFVSFQNCTYSDDTMPIDTIVSSNEIINEVLSKLVIKQEPADKDFQNYTSSDDAMPIDTYDSLNEPDIKQEPFNEDSQNCASSDDAKPIDTFVPSKEIENAEREIKKESEDSENSEEFELKEIQREKNKQKKIKNNLISENSNIFLYAKSCPNCKKSFNSSLIKKKIMHFKSCCNSKKRWVEEQELTIMIEDLKYKFKTAMEKNNHNNFDYDSSEEVAKDLETKKIYEYFSIEKLNVDSKKNMKEKKVKNKEDFRDDDHNKKLGTKIETDDIV